MIGNREISFPSSAVLLYVPTTNMLRPQPQIWPGANNGTCNARSAGWAICSWTRIPIVGPPPQHSTRIHFPRIDSVTLQKTSFGQNLSICRSFVMLLKVLAILYISFTAFVSCIPCPETDSLPQISPNGVRSILLAQFLENLEVVFFSTGAANISVWRADGSSNNSLVDSIDRIAVVSLDP